MKYTELGNCKADLKAMKAKLIRSLDRERALQKELSIVRNKYESLVRVHYRRNDA